MPVGPILKVSFYLSASGREPVREFLQALSRDDKRQVGEDIKAVQFRWPLGMPWVRKLGPDLWEVRSDVTDGIVRTIFTVVDSRMVLLHAFRKKAQKIPAQDLAVARSRLQGVRGGA